jgi:hypothetical protein
MNIAGFFRATSETILRSKVNIVRDLECASNQIDLRRGLHENLHDIEPIRDSRVVQHSEPFFCTSDDSFLLQSRNTKMRGTEGVGGASFDFDKDERCFATIPADQIDFASASRSKVFVQDAKSVPAKISSCQFFAGASELKPRLDDPASEPGWQGSNQNEKRAEQPAQTNAGGSDKVHESVNFRGGRASHSLCSGQICTADIRSAIFPSYGRV